MSASRTPLALVTAAALLLTAVLIAPVQAAQHAQRPIVFVHGQSGSAQQFETQALRFASNGYAEDLLFVFEYDTSQSHAVVGEQVDADLDAFIDGILAETGAGQVNVIAHSRGTSVMVDYLDDVHGTGINRGAKVARYANIDGRSPDHLPGGVDTIGIWGEWNSGGTFARPPGSTAQIGPDPDANHHFPEKGHTEVATSAEAFAIMYEFFTGEAPATTDVVPEPPGQVTVEGRVTLFPQNAGYAGATLEVWRVDAATGHRISNRPLATTTLDETGAFGPMRLNGQKHYEFAVTHANGSVHHFYQQPFARSTHFLRLQTSVPGTGIGAFVPTSDEHVALTVSRQREWWGDQGEANDTLEIDGLDVLTPQISPRSAVNIAVFAHDDGLDRQTDLGKGVLFPFNLLAFLTAADVFVPAAPDASGTVSVATSPRGSDETLIVQTPNWPSSQHRITVTFRDHVQDAYAWTEYPRGARR